MSSLSRVGQGFNARYLPSFQAPDFRRLWAASMFSQSAYWALIVARAALVLQLTDSAAWTGYVTFAAMIPSVAMAPIAGYLADRFNRRSVLAGAYTFSFAGAAALAVLVGFQVVEAWQVLALAAITGCARSTQMPAAQALLANMVPRDRLLNAVALHQMTFHGARFIGPFMILAVLWATGNQDLVFFAAAAMYLLGLFAVVRIRIVSRGVIEAGRGLGIFTRNMTAGLAYMYRTPLVMSIVLLVVGHCALTMSFESLFPVLSRDKLGLEEQAQIMGSVSYLMAAYGVAALMTSFYLAGVKSEGTRGRLFLVLAVLSGGTLAALAVSPNLELAILAAGGMGFAQGGFMTMSHSMLQSIAPDEIRGRLMGVYSWHIQGFMASFNLINGTLAAFTALTASMVLAFGGIGFMIVVVLSLGRLPLRQLYTRGVPAT